ncbi:DUF1049 domain-containing protein [Bacillus lacus]|uniref:DUF1049 domain-containing protein n=1 Tax=Metabacillus lacus TaxID=1983721 RepID=A0A7X2IX10_9BACI|nr:lipopolysaccharide assembly protein LapA domain-containing protein [Metabacillus lacus]MRX71388.1 DUF1049 domain-containing protein [Metabacillus lacus]
MKRQWSLLLAIAFTLLVAIFAVINVDPVEVDFLFGRAELPLILVILGSVLMGGLMVGSAGVFKMYNQQRNMKSLQQENSQLKDEKMYLTETEEEKPEQSRFEERRTRYKG